MSHLLLYQNNGRGAAFIAWKGNFFQYNTKGKIFERSFAGMESYAIISIITAQGAAARFACWHFASKMLILDIAAIAKIGFADFRRPCGGQAVSGLGLCYNKNYPFYLLRS